MMIDYSLANAPLQKELSAGSLLRETNLSYPNIEIEHVVLLLILLTRKSVTTDEVGNTAAFLASPLASAITGAVIYVDNGLNAMGVGVDSPIFAELNIPKASH